MAKRELRVGDEVIAFDDRDFTVEAIADSLYIVSDGTRRWRVAVAGPPENRWVAVDGRVAEVEILSGAKPRVRSASHDMSAPMPATVVKILVSPGAAVKKGDTLLMLEAMKMELPIRASRDGVVKEIRCQQGELVQPGVNLLELE